jgi:hypothetical protein
MAGWNMNVCCYLYQINLRKSARVLTINYTGDMKALSKYRKYWVNYDYFGFNWYDCVAQSTIVYPQKRFYNYNSLIKRNVDTLWDILVNNKIIFTNVEDARANCELYRGLLIPIERLYLIDWGSVVRDWDVILFDRYSLKDGSLMEHLWVQTLSAASGCIINTIAIESVDYVANKIDYNKWMLK